MKYYNILVAQTTHSFQKLKTSLLYRKGRWKLFRKYITTRAKITFGYLLSERNFRGRILVNHADKMLDINVSYQQPICLSTLTTNLNRSSPTSRNLATKGAKPKLFLVAKNLSQPSVSSSPSGKPWAHPFAASTNSTSSWTVQTARCP